MQNIRTEHALRDALVSEMDPGAINPGDGVVLTADDGMILFLSFFRFLIFFYPSELRESLLQAFMDIYVQEGSVMLLKSVVERFNGLFFSRGKRSVNDPLICLDVRAETGERRRSRA